MRKVKDKFYGNMNVNLTVNSNHIADLVQQTGRKCTVMNLVHSYSTVNKNLTLQFPITNSKPL
jgi:hypothetical protein